MKLKVGKILVSAVDTTAVIVIRAPERDVLLTCGGVEMVAAGETAPSAAIDPAHGGETLIGKRYVDPTGTIEVLCTKPGRAALALDGQLLAGPRREAAARLGLIGAYRAIDVASRHGHRRVRRPVTSPGPAPTG
jgi:hypothetical protein